MTEPLVLLLTPTTHTHLHTTEIELTFSYYSEPNEFEFGSDSDADEVQFEVGLVTDEEEPDRDTMELFTMEDMKEVQGLTLTRDQRGRGSMWDGDGSKGKHNEVEGGKGVAVVDYKGADAVESNFDTTNHITNINTSSSSSSSHDDNSSHFGKFNVGEIRGVGDMSDEELRMETIDALPLTWLSTKSDKTQASQSWGSRRAVDNAVSCVLTRQFGSWNAFADEVIDEDACADWSLGFLPSYSHSQSLSHKTYGGFGYNSSAVNQRSSGTPKSSPSKTGTFDCSC